MRTISFINGHSLMNQSRRPGKKAKSLFSISGRSGHLHGRTRKRAKVKLVFPPRRTQLVLSRPPIPSPFSCTCCSTQHFTRCLHKFTPACSVCLLGISLWSSPVHFSSIRNVLYRKVCAVILLVLFGYGCGLVFF